MKKFCSDCGSEMDIVLKEVDRGFNDKSGKLDSETYYYKAVCKKDRKKQITIGAWAFLISMGVLGVPLVSSILNSPLPNIGLDIGNALMTISVSLMAAGVISSLKFVNHDYFSTHEPIEEKREANKKKGGVKMPRIFRYAIYFSLVTLVWKFTSNIDKIVAFFIKALGQ